MLILNSLLVMSTERDRGGFSEHHSLVVRGNENNSIIARPSRPENLEAIIAREERTLLDGLLYYIGILLRYKWLIIITTFLAGLGSVGFAVLSIRMPPERSPLPNMYRSNAVLLMNTTGTDTAVQTFLTSLGMEPQGPGTIDYGQLALMILNSRTTIDQVIAEMNIATKYRLVEDVQFSARRIVASRSAFAYNRQTGALDISYESTDPLFSRDMVAKMVGLLSNRFADMGGSLRSKQLNILEEKLLEVSRETARLESEIKSIQTKHKALTIEDLATSQTSLLNELISQRAMKEMELKSQREFSNIDDPRTALLRIELANLDDLIQSVKDGRFASMPSQDMIPELAAVFARLNLELAIQQRIYQTLSEQYEVAKLTDVEEEFFRILEAPEVPFRKTGPQRSKLVITITMLGFFASIGLALVINAIRNLRGDPERLRILHGYGYRR